MRDGNQQLAPFAQRFAVQVDDAVFGRDPVHVTARRDDAGAGIELRDDARDLPAQSPSEANAMIGLPPFERPPRRG